MNSLHLIGRLVRDPELNISEASETSYCNFTIAIDRGKNKNGESLGVDFPRLTAFAKTAENISKYLKKGDLVCVEGQVRTGSYEKEGQKIYTTELLARRVQFLSFNKSENQDDLGEISSEALPF